MKSEGPPRFVGPSKTRACLTTRCEEAPSRDITSGIDLHRRRSVIVVLDEDGEELWNRKIDNTRENLAAAIRDAGPAPEVVIEATWGWYWATATNTQLGEHLQRSRRSDGFRLRHVPTHHHQHRKSLLDKPTLFRDAVHRRVVSVPNVVDMGGASCRSGTAGARVRDIADSRSAAEICSITTVSFIALAVRHFRSVVMSWSRRRSCRRDHECVRSFRVRCQSEVWLLVRDLGVDPRQHGQSIDHCANEFDCLLAASSRSNETFGECRGGHEELVAVIEGVGQGGACRVVMGVVGVEEADDHAGVEVGQSIGAEVVQLVGAVRPGRMLRRTQR